MSLHVRLRTAGMALSHAVFFTIALLPAKPSFAQQGAAAGRSLCHAVLRRAARHRRRGDRHRRHRRQHHRCARPAQTAARAALDRRAAAQAGDRRPGRPGVRRDARRRQPAQRLSHGDLGLRPPPHGQQLDARHVGPGRRPGHDLPARCLDRLRAAGVHADHVQRPAEQRPRARQYRLRPHQQAAVRLRSRDRDDPPHPRRRRRRPRLLRPRQPGQNEFHDVEDGQQKSLSPIAFDPNSRARIEDCQGRFDYSPQCWNFATTGRRVWGLGVRRDVMRNEVETLLRGVEQPRLRADGLEPGTRDDEKRNSVWSVRLGPNGGFDPSDVRREFIAAGFLRQAGGHRALGLQPAGERHFIRRMRRPAGDAGGRARRHPQSGPRRAESRSPIRTRRARCATSSTRRAVWRAIGRYEVGFADRRKEGAPYMRANCAGGIAFGPATMPAGSPTRASPTSSSGSRAISCARRKARAICRRDGRRRPARRRRNRRVFRAPATAPRCTVCRVSLRAPTKRSHRNAAFASTPPPPDAAGRAGLTKPT